MKKLLVVLLSTVLLTGCAKKSSEAYFESMNTFMKVQAYGEKAEEANASAQKYIGELERVISVTKPESDIYKLNHATEFPVEINDQAIELIKLALDMAKRSDGAFNPCLYPVSSTWGFTKKQYRIPSREEIDSLLPLCDYNNVKVDGNMVSMLPGMSFDLGAIGKGFAGDEAAKRMKSFGITSALLDLGGNIQLIGNKPDGTDWTIGIRNPIGDGAIGTLSVADTAVITSAGYERYFEGPDGHKYIHIFDGTTGCPVENNLLSTTAIAPSGTYCDALSTTMYVLGLEKSIDFWKQTKDFDFIIITNENKIYITKPLVKKFKLSSDCQNFQIEIIK